MQKITPFLWFNNEAEEAMDFYTSVFKNSKKGKIVRYGEGGPAPAGTVITAEFELNGQQFVALNGGPHFRFTEAVSFVIDCSTQEEVDYYWQQLTANGGQESRCGWLKDRFGPSWQVIPSALPRLLGDKDPRKSGAVMQAMLKMTKIEIASLEEAYHAA